MRRVTPSSRAAICTKPPRRISSRSSPKRSKSEHGRDQFDRLVLIAPPGVLTELKQKLSKPMAKIVVDDLQKDLTKVPDYDLTEHILPAR